MNTNRELAAILFSDISGFTQTMDTDENLAMEQVLRHKEIITHGVNGLLANANDVKGYDNCVDLLIKDQVLREQLVNRGIETVRA